MRDISEKHASVIDVHELLDEVKELQDAEKEMSTRLRESEAGAARMRKVCEMAFSLGALSLKPPLEVSAVCKAAESALATNAGRELLAEAEELKEANAVLAAISAAHGTECFEKALEIDSLRQQITTLRRKVEAAEGMTEAIKNYDTLQTQTKP